MKLGEIEVIIYEAFCVLPAEKAAYELYKKGVREIDMHNLKKERGTVISDPHWIAVENALRDMERSG